MKIKVPRKALIVAAMSMQGNTLAEASPKVSIFLLCEIGGIISLSSSIS